MANPEITAAMRLANSIIATHGMVNHLRDYDRAHALKTPEPGDHRRRYEFVLYPEKSPWSTGNFMCSLTVSYYQEDDREGPDGSLRREFRRGLALSHGAMDMELDELHTREKLIQGLAMLGELLTATLPKSIDTVVATPEQRAAKKEDARRTIICSNLIEAIGFSALKGLRTNGKSKFFAMPDGLKTPPEDGEYRWTHVRRRTRRGLALDSVTYRITVRGRVVDVARVGEKSK